MNRCSLRRVMHTLVAGHGNALRNGKRRIGLVTKRGTDEVLPPSLHTSVSSVGWRGRECDRVKLVASSSWWWLHEEIVETDARAGQAFLSDQQTEPNNAMSLARAATPSLLTVVVSAVSRLLGKCFGFSQIRLLSSLSLQKL